MNDPMAVILTVAVIELALTPDQWHWTRLLEIPVQLLIGGAIGIGLGLAGRWGVGRIRPATIGLYPAVTLAIAFLSFGITTVLGGSGLLSVYVTALVLGSAALPYRAGLKRVHDALAWLSQIGLFLMLGLLVFPSSLPAVAGVGLGAALF